LRLRSATPGDADALAPLLAELGYPTEPVRLRARLDRVLAAECSGVLLAEIDGTPAALLAYQLIEHLERPAPTSRITALVTDPRLRRRGAATALLEAISDLARGLGCERLEVTTRPPRDDALAFYLAAGFGEQPRRLVRPLDG
jgi:GNAT superfamily N-acetyltransferase